MTSLSMSPSMRARSNEKLFLLGMIDRKGELTNMGAFAAELGCQPENAALLCHARKFEVMEDALTIFAIMERGQGLLAKERRVKVPHPDWRPTLTSKCMALSAVAGSSNPYTVTNKRGPLDQRKGISEDLHNSEGIQSRDCHEV